MYTPGFFGAPQSYPFPQLVTPCSTQLWPYLHIRGPPESLCEKEKTYCRCHRANSHADLCFWRSSENDFSLQKRTLTPEMHICWRTLTPEVQICWWTFTSQMQFFSINTYTGSAHLLMNADTGSANLMMNIDTGNANLVMNTYTGSRNLRCRCPCRLLGSRHRACRPWCCFRARSAVCTPSGRLLGSSLGATRLATRLSQEQEQDVYLRPQNVTMT